MAKRTRRSKKIDCGGPRATRCRRRQAPPSKFDKRSFRIVKRGKVQITIACPKGHWDAKRDRCDVGTRAQTVTYPMKARACAPCRRA